MRGFGFKRLSLRVYGAGLGWFGFAGLSLGFRAYGVGLGLTVHYLGFRALDCFRDLSVLNWFWTGFIGVLPLSHFAEAPTALL